MRYAPIPKCEKHPTAEIISYYEIGRYYPVCAKCWKDVIVPERKIPKRLLERIQEIYIRHRRQKELKNVNVFKDELLEGRNE